jgi:hypothetical protein
MDAGQVLPEGRRLQDGQPALDRQALHRARQRPQAAAGRPIGLRQDKRNVVAGVDEPPERLRGELWGTGEC